MVIGERIQERDFSDQNALDRCKENLHTAITYLLGRVEAAARPNVGEETKHGVTMAQLKGMPIEMLDRSYNLHRLINQGIDLARHPECRTYQTFYEIGTEPPRHEEMANTINEKTRAGSKE